MPMSFEINTGDTFANMFLGKLFDATVYLELMFVGPDARTFTAYQVSEIVAKVQEVIHARATFMQYLEDNSSDLMTHPDAEKVLSYVSEILHKVSGKYL